MTTADPRGRSPRARATDPSTPAAELAELAAASPEVHALIAVHPNAYPALLQWLAGSVDPAVAAALARRSSPHDFSEAAPPTAPTVEPPADASPTPPSRAPSGHVSGTASTATSRREERPPRMRRRILIIGGSAIVIVIAAGIVLFLDPFSWRSSFAGAPLPAPSASSTIGGSTEQEAIAAAAALEAVPNDPVGSASAASRDAVIANLAEAFPPGTRIEADPATWEPAGAGAGTIAADLYPPGATEPQVYLAFMVFEEGAWKLDATVPVS